MISLQAKRGELLNSLELEQRKTRKFRTRIAWIYTDMDYVTQKSQKPRKAFDLWLFDLKTTESTVIAKRFYEGDSRLKEDTEKPLTFDFWPK